ncbi:MAG: hypothetical protein A2X86_16500 [Bdellovibrionales bacterium GWA2_49_15]|nr:MAG: hypothetical protein A2X86_16500 [Bdellovibrionales bacterium GWA2_49_15]HAZ13706.1 hypothetical protein [Bdellovibrionales bacterium]
MRVLIGLLLGASAWAQEMNVILPEYDIFKSYDRCLIDQGDLWAKLFGGRFVEPTYETGENETPTFGLGFETIYWDEIKGKLNISYWPQNGSLHVVVLEQDPKWQTFYLKKKIALESIYIPYIKYDTHIVRHEVINRLGEREEYETMTAKNLRFDLFPWELNGPFKNAQTGLPILDSEGKPLRFNRAKFAECVQAQITKRALAYTVTELETVNFKRADYLRRLAHDSRNFGGLYHDETPAKGETASAHSR